MSQKRDMQSFLADRRLWLVVAAVAAIVLVRISGFHSYLSFDVLKSQRAFLSAFITENYLIATLSYVAIYTVVVALSLPGAFLMTLAGGFFFGALVGASLAVAGATIGAILIFLFARSIFGENALDRFGDAAARLAVAIRREAAVYLLVLRLVPLFPFFLVNLVPAFVGVRLSTFAITTFVGIIPATVVYSLAGAGLGSILDRDEEISASAILTPEILAGLLGLALLTLSSIPLRRWLARSSDRTTRS